MSKLVVFNQVTADGYIADRNGDMSWAHKQDAEWTAFVTENTSGGGAPLFGRVTYEMMAGYWPTKHAAENMPVVARQMNSLPKVVVSKILDGALWNNTKLIKGDFPEEARKLKKTTEGDIFIFGSGSVVSQLAQAGLIDEYQLIINPVILGVGKSMFAGLDKRLDLKLMNSRTFGNGNILLCYQA